MVQFENVTSWLVSIIDNLKYPGNEEDIPCDEDSGFTWFFWRKTDNLFYKNAKEEDWVVLITRPDIDDKEPQRVYKHYMLNEVIEDKHANCKTYHYNVSHDEQLNWQSFLKIAKQAGLPNLGSGLGTCRKLSPKQSRLLFELWRKSDNDHEENREIYNGYSGNFYPELVARKGNFPSIEIDINHIPEKYQGNWTQVVIKATKKWINNNSFSKKGTIWMWTTSSVNFHRNLPNFTEFIIPLGFPKNFLLFLNASLVKSFGNRNVRLSDYLKYSDEWMTLCHVENGKVWKEVEASTYEIA